MGYYMNLVHADFKMKKENFDDALKEIKENNPQYRDLGDPNPLYENCKTIFEAIDLWGFGLEIDNETGDIDGIYFDGEKLLDHLKFFNVIAPFIEDGSYIQMNGECTDMWRWVFRDGKCKEIYPTVTWG